MIRFVRMVADLAERGLRMAMGARPLPAAASFSGSEKLKLMTSSKPCWRRTWRIFWMRSRFRLVGGSKERRGVDSRRDPVVPVEPGDLLDEIRFALDIDTERGDLGDPRPLLALVDPEPEIGEKARHEVRGDLDAEQVEDAAMA